MIFYKIDVKLNTGVKILFEGKNVHELMYEIDRRHGHSLAALTVRRFIREGDVVRELNYDDGA